MILDELSELNKYVAVHPRFAAAFDYILNTSFDKMPVGKKEIDGKLVFIPLYVGISKDLNNRLWQHYCEEKTGGNSKWYVFDYFNLNKIDDVKDLYSDMKIADSKKGVNS